MPVGRTHKGPYWNDEEDGIIKRTYPHYGSQLTQERLAKRGYERSVAAIWHRAKRLKLAFAPEVKDKLVPLVEAHPNIRGNNERFQASKSIVRAAEEDGVLVRSRTYPHTYMAPEKWVEKYVDEYSERLEEDRLVERTWLSSRQVADLFGVSYSSFHTLSAASCTKKYSIHTHLERIPNRTVNSNTYGAKARGRYWKPEEATREAHAYRTRKRNKKRKIK